MTTDYTDGELERLRAVIAGLQSRDAESVRETAAAVAEGRCPPHLAPFWCLAGDEDDADTDPELFGKLAGDPLLPTYSIYGLFPGVYERIYGDGQRPTLAFDGRTRGRVAILRFDEGHGLVVKPLQSRREGTISQIAGEERVGPQQQPSLEGFITEEFVSGLFFSDLPQETVAEETIYRIGRDLGGMLARLHARQVYYNDATLSDPEGRSHLIVLAGYANQANAATNNAAGDGCRLIDFGVSVLLDNHPNLEPEEVYNLVRTTPEFRLFSGLFSGASLGGPEISRFLEQYRQRLARVSREDILARDLRFVAEGLQQTARRLGNHITTPFRAGFDEGYA